MEELNTENFEARINGGLVLVDFWAPWCAPCRVLSGILQKVSEKYKETVFIGSVNIDEHASLAEKFDIVSVPTIVALRGGAEVGRRQGLLPQAEIEKFIDGMM